MELVVREEKRYVECYDFLFTTGMVLPITLDLKAGDSIEFKDKEILISFVVKPSITDPDVMLPAEEQTIFKKHLACIQHRTQEFQEATPEQKQEWTKLFNKQENTTH